MYETFFKFHSRPFPSAPQTKTYFPAAIIENARSTLSRVVERSEGPGLVCGPPGTGKTLLCQLLAEQFQDRFAVALLACGRLKTCTALFQAILYELGLPFRGMNEGELRLSLMDYLEPKSAGHHGLLLLVDEAHTLPLRLLDELRMITNLVRDGQPRVRVVLAGASELEERFASPKLGSFSQRVAGRCYLEPLDSVETTEYVRAQIAAAGGDAARLVTDDALRSVYRATDGIPRLINQVCDHALILASLGGHQQLTSEAIDESWADLQQLPPPWSPASDSGGDAQVVEFGNLDDDSADLPEAIPFRGAPSKQGPSPLHVSEPEEQLDAIAEQLSTIENGGAPLAASGTEVELDFPEFSDPFGERFAEEEVVVHRYSSDVEIFADVPRVSSWEGQQLGSMLEAIDAAQPWQESPQQPNVRITQPVAEDATKPTAAQQSASSTFSPASDPVLPEEPIPAAATAGLSGSAANMVGQDPGGTPENGPTEELNSRTEPVVRPDDRSLDKLAGVASDRDVIVVEDDPTTVPLTQPSGAEPRKPEFRQLFARLRRG
jgi:type II secretory pathway predicted ATPase ExeA